MSEFKLTVDGEDHEVTEDNHTVNLFRDTPEYNYIVLRPTEDPVEAQRNILIFRQQWLCHWMGNLALNAENQAELERRNEELGTFSGRFGFNSKVLIEDSANDFEVEYFTQGLLSDLRGTEGVPEGWGDVGH